MIKIAIIGEVGWSVMPHMTITYPEYWILQQLGGFEVRKLEASEFNDALPLILMEITPEDLDQSLLKLIDKVTKTKGAGGDPRPFFRVYNAPIAERVRTLLGLDKP